MHLLHQTWPCLPGDMRGYPVLSCKENPLSQQESRDSAADNLSDHPRPINWGFFLKGVGEKSVFFYF